MVQGVVLWMDIATLVVEVHRWCVVWRHNGVRIRRRMSVVS